MSYRDRALGVRAHPLVLGVVLFLASESMFFAGLFAAYFDLRAQTAPWPPAGVVLDAKGSTLGTFLLFASSLVMIAMTRALNRGKTRAAHRWLFTGILSGIFFIAIALDGWAHNPFTISSSAYGSIYYAMTGFHVLHVCAGIVMLVALYFGLRSPALQHNHRAGAEAIMYYWHFVFVVWLGIWGTIYLIR